MNYLEYFTDLTQVIGDREDYFQGPGGNVSFKINDTTMLIKASGKRVSEMNTPLGIVEVSFNKLRDYFSKPVVDYSQEEEVASASVLIESTITGGGLRPSIETGFHAILGTAVIHSHNIYINIFACAENSTELFAKIPKQSGIYYAIADYATPGYFLTHAVKRVMSSDISVPQVIFMKNHGVIISAPTIEEALQIHETITKDVQELVKYSPYPKSHISKNSDGTFLSTTPYLQSFIQEYPDYIKNIRGHILFPDLMVFCNNISLVETSAKIFCDIQQGRVTYTTNEKETQVIEENLVAWAYLMTTLKENSLIPIYIPDKLVTAIESMESEDYRKKLLLQE